MIQIGVIITLCYQTPRKKQYIGFQSQEHIVQIPKCGPEYDVTYPI